MPNPLVAFSSCQWLDAVLVSLQVVPGELTIVTGLPNSGKSEWLDALAVNLARQNNWNFALCSLENTPKEHARKLMEKYTGGIGPPGQQVDIDQYAPCLLKNVRPYINSHVQHEHILCS